MHPFHAWPDVQSSDNMLISVRRILLAMGIAVAMALPLRAGSYRWTTSGPEPGLIIQIVVNPQYETRDPLLTTWG